MPSPASPSDTISIAVPGVAAPLVFTRSDHDEFWELFGAGQWESETLELLVRLLGPGSNFVDVGAWIGPLSILAARRGAHVLAFEPDPVARGLLATNLGLNSDVAQQVEVRPVALSTSEGVRVLATAKLGDSMASFAHGGPEATDVPTIDVKPWSTTADFRSADVLKIDIEGAEFAVLPRMSGAFRDHRPVMLLSVHGYQFRLRFTHLPERVGKVVRRAWNGANRARLLLATRRYQRRWIWSAADAQWHPLTMRDFPQFLGSLLDTELVLADRDVMLSPRESEPSG